MKLVVWESWSHVESWSHELCEKVVNVRSLSDRVMIVFVVFEEDVLT